MKRVLFSLLIIVSISASVASAGELQLANLQVDSSLIGTEGSVQLTFDLIVTPPVFQSAIGILVVDPLGEETLICSSYSPPGQFPGTYSLGHTVLIDEDLADGEWGFTALVWQSTDCAIGLIPDDSESVSLFLDITAPQIDLDLPDEPFTLNEQSAVIGISDGAFGSGIDWERSDILGAVLDENGDLVIDTSTAGLHVASFNLYDIFGNETSVTYEYEVNYAVEGAGSDGSFLANSSPSSGTIDGVILDGLFQSGELIEIAFALTDIDEVGMPNAMATVEILTSDGETVSEKAVASFNIESENYELILDTSNLSDGIYQLHIKLSECQEIVLMVGIEGETSIAAGGGGSDITFGI